MTSLVLGLLQTLEQCVYLLSDLGSARAAVTVGDAVGLAASLCIVLGAALGIAATRRVRGS